MMFLMWNSPSTCLLRSSFLLSFISSLILNPLLWFFFLLPYFLFAIYEIFLSNVVIFYDFFKLFCFYSLFFFSFFLVFYVFFYLFCFYSLFLFLFFFFFFLVLSPFIYFIFILHIFFVLFFSLVLFLLLIILFFKIFFYLNLAYDALFLNLKSVLLFFPFLCSQIFFLIYLNQWKISELVKSQEWDTHQSARWRSDCLPPTIEKQYITIWAISPVSFLSFSFPITNILFCYL